MNIYNRLDERPNTSDPRITDIQQLIIIPSTQPIDTSDDLPEHNDLGARERCCRRYIGYYHAIVAVFVILNVSIYFIAYIINMYHSFPKSLHDHLFGGLILSLFGVLLIYATIMISILAYEHVCMKKCRIPPCCGCQWIERHQMRYENV
jgi:hypothetical protein